MYKKSAVRFALFTFAFSLEISSFRVSFFNASYAAGPGSSTGSLSQGSALAADADAALTAAGEAATQAKDEMELSEKKQKKVDDLNNRYNMCGPQNTQCQNQINSQIRELESQIRTHNANRERLQKQEAEQIAKWQLLEDRRTGRGSAYGGDQSE